MELQVNQSQQPHCKLQKNVKALKLTINKIKGDFIAHMMLRLACIISQVNKSPL